MKIGEAEKKIGVKKSTIRNYVTRGIIKPKWKKRDATTEHREPFEFTEEDLRQIKAIRCLIDDIGFELDEITEILKKISLNELKKKIYELPFPMLLRFIEEKGVKLIKREFIDF